MGIYGTMETYSATDMGVGSVPYVARAPDPGLDPDLPHGETDRRSSVSRWSWGRSRERCVDHRTKQRCNLASRCSGFVSPPPCLL
ncbi:unnamed protein product [Gadus morhua 'NCC']